MRDLCIFKYLCVPFDDFVYVLICVCFLNLCVFSQFVYAFSQFVRALQIRVCIDTNGPPYF